MIKQFFSFIILFSLLSCSSEKPSEMNVQKPLEPGGTAPATATPVTTGAQYSLQIVPADVTRNSTLSLLSIGFDPKDAQILWTVNGNPVISSLTNQFKTSEAKKGDMIQAKATLAGKEIFSNIVKIKNSPPGITSVKLLPESFKPGDALSIEAATKDPDNDDVTLIYEWTLNGEPAGNTKQIGSQVKKGDKVSIKITPFDGEIYGRPVFLNIRMQNLPPVIIDDKKFSFDGKVYTYQVRASDADNDPLAYSLKEAPPGMTIDKTGLIKWNVPPDFKGKASCIVSVTDGQGGEAILNFTIDITPEK